MRAVLLLSPLLALLLLLSAPAAAQVRTEARIEKDRYITGEPIFVLVDVTNIGVQPVAYDGSFDSINPSTVELSVEGSRRRPPLADAIASCVALLFVGRARSRMGILDHPPVLAPGERRTFRYLLTDYDLVPGRYQLIARGRANLEWREGYAPIDPSTIPAGSPVARTKTFREPVDGSAVDARFDLFIEPGSDDELRAAFAPFVADADGPDVPKRVEARRTIMRLAPALLEEAIARWTGEAADRGDGLAWTGADALARIGTAGSRAALQQLAIASADEQVRLAAVSARRFEERMEGSFHGQLK